MRSGRPAASPHMPTMMPASTAAFAVIWIAVITAGLVTSFSRRDRRMKPVGGHDVLRQVVGSDGEEGDMLRQFSGAISTAAGVSIITPSSKRANGVPPAVSSAAHSSISFFDPLDLGDFRRPSAA